MTHPPLAPRGASRPALGFASVLAGLTCLSPSPLAAQGDQLTPSSGATAPPSATPIAPPAGVTPGATPIAPPDPQAEPPSEATSAVPPPFPLRVTASIFSRPELRQGYEQLGQADTDFVRYRFRLGLSLEPIDLGRVSVGGRLAPQAAGFWSSGGTLTDPALGIHEAVLLLGTERLAFELGRFEMSYGEEVVIGTVGWHQVGRAFDGARLRTKLAAAGAFVDVFATQLTENLDTNFAAGDVIFLGAYAGLGPLLGEGLELDVYAFELLLAEDPDPDPALSAPRRHVSTLGSRLLHRGEHVEVRAEVGVQLQGAEGADLQVAYHADAEVGVRVGSRFRLSAEALYASGAHGRRVAAWNQLFPTAHKFLGFSDIMGGRANVVSGALHAWASLADGVGANLDVHVFARPEGAASGYHGLEADLGLAWTIGRGLVLRGLYCLFVPAEDAFGTTTPAHFAELELRYTLTPPPAAPVAAAAGR